MPVPDWYIERLKEEIVRLKEVLEPLESGKVRIGDKPHIGDRIGDRTQAQILAFRRSIAELQSIVDTRDA